MNKGTNQYSRRLKALNPEYIQLDERTTEDLVMATLEHANKLIFYDLDDRPKGNWAPFLLKDPSFVLGVIAATDIGKYASESAVVKNTKGPDKKAFRAIAQGFMGLFLDVRKWCKLLQQTGYQGLLLDEALNLEDSLFENFESINMVVQNRQIEMDHYLEDFRAQSLSALRSRNEQKGLSKSTSGLMPHFGFGSTYAESPQADSLECDAIKAEFDLAYGKVIYFKETVARSFAVELAKHQHQPHIALLLTFFELYGNAQKELNQLTQRHLDFYYKNLLQQKPKDRSTKQRIMVGCSLKPQIQQFKLPQHSRFGLEWQDHNHIYQLTEPVMLNEAKLVDVRTLYREKIRPFGDQYDLDPFYYYEFTQAVVEDFSGESSMGNSGKIAELPLTYGGPGRTQSELGFVISSPVLILEEGEQEILLKLRLSQEVFRPDGNSAFDRLLEQKVEEIDQTKSMWEGLDEQEREERIKEGLLFKFFKSAFDVYVTTASGWRLVSFTQSSLDGKTVRIKIPLSAGEERLCSFNHELHQGGFQTPWPCIKICLNHSAVYHPYVFMQDWTLEYIEIETEVSSVKNLSLSNAHGDLDSSIPFAPFGSLPETGSFLRIQNDLILQRNLSLLELDIRWSGLPQQKEGFKSHYKEYHQSIDNGSFKARLGNSRDEIANNTEANGGFRLFGADATGRLHNSLKLNVDLGAVQYQGKMPATISADYKNKQELYMVLTDPPMGFGHASFPKVYAKAAMKRPGLFRKAADLPNQPYIPVIDQLVLRYKNRVREYMQRKQDDDTAQVKLIHLCPFGHLVQFPGSLIGQCHLLPQLDTSGNLYLGLRQVKPNDRLSLGFELWPAKEFHSIMKIPEANWAYLHNNQWRDLNPYIEEDQTDGLIKTGLVKIHIPGTIQFENSRFRTEAFWIRVSYTGDQPINSKIKRIFTQALILESGLDATAEVDDEMFFAQNQMTAINLKEIDKVIGPIPLELGQKAESEAAFYNRVSESLRHKSRGVTNWDLERMVLEAFPQIDKVRAFGRNQYRWELVKGCNTQIVVIQKNRKGNAISAEDNKLDVATLKAIKRFVKSLVSPYVKVEVCNPVYEKLKVRCRVLFKDILKNRMYQERLNNELVAFLSPDITEFDADTLFERSFTKSEIYNFIENRSYVDKVTEFSVLQLVDVIDKHRIIDTEDERDPNKFGTRWELQTISAYAILTSVPKHHIKVEEGHQADTSKIQGIGDIAVESDFILTDKTGKYIID